MSTTRGERFRRCACGSDGGLGPGGGAHLQQHRNQPAPAGLVRGAQTATAVAVEIFIKQQMVAEPGPAKALVAAEHWPGSISAAQKDAAQPIDDLIGDFSKAAHASRTHRALHSKLIAIIAVKPVERFDNQIIERHPYRPAPIRIATEDPRIRIARHVIEAELSAATVDLIGM